MRRYSICPWSLSSPIGPSAGTGNASTKHLAIARRPGETTAHRDDQFIPVQRSIALQVEVGTRDEEVAALQLRTANENAAVGVRTGAEFQPQFEVARIRADRLQAGVGAEEPRDRDDQTSMANHEAIVRGRRAAHRQRLIQVAPAAEVAAVEEAD
jgi:hypothetical protein